MACILLGAASSDLFMIASSGRLSMGIVTFGWPNMYWWKLFMANTIARHSNSIGAQFDSILLKDLDALATGLSSCSNTAPSPAVLAYVCITIGFRLS